MVCKREVPEPVEGWSLSLSEGWSLSKSKGRTMFQWLYFLTYTDSESHFVASVCKVA